MRSLWNAAKMSGKLIFFSFFFFRLEKKKGFSFPQLLIVHENPLCKSRSREPPPGKSSFFLCQLQLNRPSNYSECIFSPWAKVLPVFKKS